MKNLGRSSTSALFAVLVALLLPAAAQASGQVFYGGWYDDAIGSVAFDGSSSNPNLVVNDRTVPEALLVSGEFLYWERNSAPISIGRSRLDGSEVQLEFIEGTGGSAMPTGLSVSDGRLYWAETRNASGFGPALLSSANLDGSSLQSRTLSLGANAGGTVLVTGKWVFYVIEKDVRGVQRYSVARSRLDGKGSRRLVAANRPLATDSLAVSGSHIYWLEEGEHNDFIARASVDAASINTRFRKVPDKGCHSHSDMGDIAISSEYFFVGCQPGQIDRISLKGRPKVRELSTGAKLSSGPVLAATP